MLFLHRVGQNAYLVVGQVPTRFKQNTYTDGAKRRSQTPIPSWMGPNAVNKRLPGWGQNAYRIGPNAHLIGAKRLPGYVTHLNA
jgi:hypothetical protein